MKMEPLRIKVNKGEHYKKSQKYCKRYDNDAKIDMGTV